MATTVYEREISVVGVMIPRVGLCRTSKYTSNTWLGGGGGHCIDTTSLFVLVTI